MSAKKNGFDISKSTFNRITKRDLKWCNIDAADIDEQNNVFENHLYLYVYELY